jgi:pimeloyl-ACP methyl ester carboxylesterase
MTALTVFKAGNPANPVIVFLHALGITSWMWTDQVESLKADHYCLSIDLPGNGDSYQAEWGSLANAAAQVANTIRAEVPGQKVHLVGLSLGGYVALQVLADHPDMVESVIVSGVTVEPFKNPWMMRAMLTVMAPMMAWGPMIQLNIKTMHLPPETAPMFKRDAKRMKPSMFKAMYNEVLTFQPPATLKQRYQPVLAVAGDSEVEMIRDNLGKMVDLLPNVQTALVPNAHHGWSGEHPALFTAMIRAWVEEAPLPSELQVQGEPARVLA